MIFGERLKELRKERGLSQGDIEQKTRLLRCYISRVEHGHTVPTLAVMERFARALGIEMWEFFGTKKPSRVHSLGVTARDLAGNSFLRQIADLMPKIKLTDRKLLVQFAGTLARKGGK
jgi:transcriptional regulator with XRE-family HTH domain